MDDEYLPPVRSEVVRLADGDLIRYGGRWVEIQSHRIMGNGNVLITAFDEVDDRERTFLTYVGVVRLAQRLKPRKPMVNK